ncbi:MAG TPA: alpha-glucan family phosphorylase [Acidimicrobiia bacterium]|jgi:starch phosphorylase|nr:alpha-glucan family phosphorylase [Acidimicrobiia bacterium]
MDTTQDLFDRIPVGPKTPLAIPSDFDRIHDIAYNMWWSWSQPGKLLFNRMDPLTWERNRNPLSLLQAIEQSTWESLARSDDFLQLYDETVIAFDKYMAGSDTWYAREHAGELQGAIAYLCAEFGIHSKLSLYSGGLGVLAGDHVKAASDLGLPLVAVGLLYRRGYFRQAVDPEGYQQHTYIPFEEARRPVRQVLDPRTGWPLRVTVQLPGRDVVVGAWRIDVGRVPVILLDTDLPDNAPADRPITHILYVRGRAMRLCQEIVLGIGGTRVLSALGIEPAVWHVNEGHAALSLLERLSRKLETGMSMDEAQKAISASTLFTLHTPVPAGNERFDLDLALSALSGTLPGIDDTALSELSRSHSDHEFDMGALAIRLSSITNGVSKRHGEVVSSEWGPLIGGPAKGITNGIHPQTWVGRAMSRIYTKTVGELWTQQVIDHGAWEAVREVPAEELWQAHHRQKTLMLRRLRARLREQFARHGQSPARLRWLDDQLHPDALTIVFARRFATYKRAGLLFSDPHRVRALLTNPDRPVQVIFAGKAHPADREGQGLVKWVFDMSMSPGLEGKVWFIENYDMDLGGTLVRGADVWLNTPTPPKEASGTSGMKAAANGALNLSVLDGWWAEGYNGKNGWGFSEESHSDVEDAGILYHLLESEVIPKFFDRDENGIPQAWVDMMKESIVSAIPAFTTQRMLVDYSEEAYLPLGRG